MCKKAAVAVVFPLLLFLSGCLYPGSGVTGRFNHEAALEMVQTAVEQFQKDRGILPIQTRAMETPIYRKYPIDFNRLIPEYLSHPPANAYVEGGVYQYVIVWPDENPHVKLIDLRTVDVVLSVQRRVRVYLMQHGSVPYDDVLARTRYTLDFDKLGYEQPPYVKSPFTGKLLPLIVDHNANVYIHYGKDLFEMLQKYEPDFTYGEDIRELLVRHSSFVPVYSVPYTVKDGEPVFLLKKANE